MISDTPEWVERLRADLPVVERFNYLNAGTAGPVARACAKAIAAEAAIELELGRGNFATWSRFFELLDRCRELVARLLGADADEISLAHHTSDGINIALWGLDWRPGDEVVTTNLEHDAGVIPLGVLRDRRGVELRFAEIGMGERALDGLREVLSSRTRIVLLSHVTYNTGAELPVAELIELCHEAGALVLIDGAQTCGARPIDVHRLDADLYTLSGQKWVCGPEGCGALYVRRELLDRLSCTFSSYFTARKHDFRGNLELHPSAKRFETGMVYRPALAGFAASLGWILDQVGVERAWERSLSLAARARAALARLPAVEIISPEELPSHLLAFDLPAFSPAQLYGLTTWLAKERRIVIRSTPHDPFVLRASFGFFNTAGEVRELVDAIEEAISRGPEAIEIEGYGLSLPSSR